jgi:hypothetical protein
MLDRYLVIGMGNKVLCYNSYPEWAKDDPKITVITPQQQAVKASLAIDVQRIEPVKPFLAPIHPMDTLGNIPIDLLLRLVYMPSGKPNWDALEPTRINATKELRCLLERRGVISRTKQIL